jgi:very-short-patch-repair endonuclease
MAIKPPKGKSLAEVNPELAKQWHPTENGDLTPSDVSTGSGAKVWWKCSEGDDHEWESTILSRNYYGSICAICSSKKLVLSNCLATRFPGIAKQWHPTKNGDLTPYDLFPSANKKVWWKCDKANDHIWQSSPNSRTNTQGSCPMCNGRYVVKSNCLATLNPKLAKEWHPTKNGNLTPFDVTEKSGKKIWWKCDKGEDHEWKTTSGMRMVGTNCPVCKGKKVGLSNCLAKLNPNLAKDWHPTKNGNLTPFDITENSAKKVWWKCDKAKDHEWLASPNGRINSGCPMCSSLYATKSNCLATLNPKLAKEWHPTKNGDLTPNDVTLYSNKKVWWKCTNGDDHEWLAVIATRNVTACPYCDLTPQSKQELTITFELIQFFKDINPKGFKTRVKGKLWSIDIYIPQLKLGIEFDGSYWHKDKRALDKLKTEQLEDEGFEIFRVRQEPLKRIFDNDIMSKQPFNAKQVANDILTQIMTRYTIDAQKIAKIESYISKKELQNEKGLDKYIDMILTEKAEKKN